MKFSNIKTRTQFYEAANTQYQRTIKLAQVWQNPNKSDQQREKAFRLWCVMAVRTINLLNVACKINAVPAPSSFKQGGIVGKSAADAKGYFEALEEWENLFYCNECGETDIEVFTYNRTVANGCEYKCSCGNYLLVGHKPNEDNF